MEDYQHFYYALFDDISTLVMEMELKIESLNYDEILLRLNQILTDAEERFISYPE